MFSKAEAEVFTTTYKLVCRKIDWLENEIKNYDIESLTAYNLRQNLRILHICAKGMEGITDAVGV